MRRGWICAAVAFLSVLAGSELLHAASRSAPSVPGEVLVRFSPVTARRVAGNATVPDLLRREGVREAVRATRALPDTWQTLDRRFGFDRLYRLKVDPSTDLEALCARLIALPGIEFAHPNYLGRGGEVQVIADDTFFDTQWHLNNTGQALGTPDADIDAVEAWNIASGRRETRIAVLDSGIDGDHPEFRGRIARGGVDEVNGDADPEDDHGHGTRVSGLAGADANNRFSVSGVDWHARILPVKVLDQFNRGTVLALVNGLRHAAAVGADVANLSLIRYPDVESLRLAVEFAHAAGVILIGCNGNDGTDSINYPAGYPQVLATGWTDRWDRRAYSSNTTTVLDVVAPGSAVVTPLPYTHLDDTDSFSGCSAATPVASGAASLLLALDPTLTFEQLRDILRRTADDEVGQSDEDLPGRDDHHGWGRINLHAALLELGLVSRDRVHVEDVALKRVSTFRLEIRVLVLDELSGVEPGVTVRGTLQRPDATTASLQAVTQSNGVAVLAHEPGSALPAGAFSFGVDALDLPGIDYDPASDVVGQVSHDPDLNALHVGSIDLYHAEDRVIVEVQVVDDDGVPEGEVQVSGRLTPPAGAALELLESSSWAGAGVARFESTPEGGGAPETGLWSFEVLDLIKPGFVYDSAGDLENIDGLPRLDPAADPDEDGTSSGIDNCPLLANADQADGDGDGVGDACDVCPARIDPAQEDLDGDGAGDRCDCAPYDANGTGLGEVRGLRAGAPTGSWLWHGVSGADTYDLLRGNLADLDGAGYGDCLADDLTARNYEDGAVPLPGEGFYYLVRADDAVCGSGPAGPGVGGAERGGAASVCD